MSHEVRMAIVESKLDALDELALEVKKLNLQLSRLQELDSLRESRRDHEQRLRLLEAAMTKLLVYATIAAAVGSTVATTVLQVILKGIM